MRNLGFRTSTALFCLLALPASAARLPRVVIPTHYALTVTPDIEAERFRGEVTIDGTVQRPTNEVVVNAAEMTFRNASILAGGRTLAASVTLDAASERATLRVGETVPVGPISIRIEYDGILNRQLRGFYIGVANGRKYLASQMEATDARRAFPSFDEPDLKATFDLTVIARANDAVISNSPVASETAGPGANQKTVRFATTPRLSTYHIALVVGDFQCLRDSADGIPLGICAWSDRVGLGQLSMDSTKELMRFFKGYYAMPYPFAKLDQIALTDFAAGAMENPGAITYRERGLLADPATSSFETRRRGVGTIAHEIAHMWFGDLVTMRWWDDIWLNEGFASWMARKAVEETFRSGVPATYVVDANERPLAVDVLSTTRAIRKSAETPEEIDQLFDAIAYSKTAALLEMLESYVGDEKFREGINLYLTRNAWSNASGSDFAAAMNDATGRDVAEILASYISQPGVPLVRVETRCQGDETVVELKQERFLLRGGEETRAQIWTIPVCLSGGDCVVLREREQTFRLKGCRSGALANREGRGYYIVSSKNTPAVANLTPSERTVLLRDSWYLVRSGQRSIGEHFDLAQSLGNDPHLMQNILSHAVTAERFLATDAQRPALQAWIRRLGHATPKRTAELFETLGNAGADPQVRKESRQIATKTLSNPAAAGDPAIATQALTIAAIEGDRKLYDSYLRAYRSTTDPAVRSRIIAALPAFRDPALLRRTLDLALTDDVRSQDLASLLAGAIENRANSEMAWRFVADNWTAIAQKLPPGHAGRVIGAGAVAFCDAKWADEVQRFGKDIKEARQSTAQTVERIQNCADLRNLQSANLSTWLSSR